MSDAVADAVARLRAARELWVELDDPPCRAVMARMVWTSRQPRSGFASSISAVTPATMGEAAEVPPKCVV